MTQRVASILRTSYMQLPVSWPIEAAIGLHVNQGTPSVTPSKTMESNHALRTETLKEIIHTKPHTVCDESSRFRKGPTRKCP